jgi:hypothetical protein
MEFLRGDTRGSNLLYPVEQKSELEHDEIFTEGSILTVDTLYSPTFSVDPPPDRLIWAMINPYYEMSSPISLTKLEIQKALLAQIAPLIFERNKEETDRQIERLFGPSDADSSIEFLNLIIYFSSNNMKDLT